VADYQINTLLDETKAILVSHEAVANEADRILVRRWDRIPNQFLNGLESDVRARRKETNPTADIKTFNGTWRIVTVEIERGKSDTNGGALIETLAFGFQTTLAEDEARTAQIAGEPASAGFALTRAWVYVDPHVADTLVATLNAVTTVVDPQGDGQTYSGTFVAGQVLQSENKDGSVTITQTLSKVTAIPDFATLYALTPSEKRSTKEQVHPFDSNGDYLVYTVNQTVTREIQTFRHLYSEYRTTIDAITPTQLTAMAPSGFAFVNKDLKEEEDGSLTLDVVFQDITDKDIYLAQTVENAALGTVATQLYLEQGNDTPLDTSSDIGQGAIVASKVTRREDGRFDKEKQVETSVALYTQFRSQSALFRQEYEILYSNSRTKIAAPDATGSGIYRVQQRQNKDGTYSGSLVYEYGLAAGEVSWDSQNSTLQKSDTVLYKDWNAKINSPPSVTGAIYNATNNLTDRGTYDAQLVYQESIADTARFRQSSTRFRDGQAILYENSRSTIVAPSATGSGIYQVNQRMNQDGTYSGSLTYEYGTNTGYAEFASNEAVLASADTIIYKDVNEQIASPPAALGGIYSVTNSLTERGTYDARLLYEGSIAANTEFRSRSTRFVTGNSIAYDNWRSKLEAPTATGSGVYTVSQRVNQDGTYSGQLDYQYGNNAGEAVATSRQSTLSTDKEVIYRSRASQVDAPASAVGAVYDVSNTLGDDGLYDARLVYQESTAKNVAFVASTAAQRTRSSLVYENRREQIAAPALTAGNGGIYETAQRLNEDGTYTGGITYQQSTADQIYFASLNTRFVAGKTIQFENHRSVVTAPPATGSGIYRVSQRENEDGTYSGSLVYENGSDAGDAIFDSKKSELATAVTRIYRDVTSQINAPASAQGAIYNTTNTLTERGTYDARLVYDASVYKTATARVRSTLFNEANALIYENSRSVIVAPAATGSGLYSVTQRMNEDGTYSGQLVYENGLNAGHAVFTSRDSALSSDKEVLYKNRTTQVDAPTSAQGAIYDVSNSLSDNGLYDARLIYQKSNDDTVYFVSSNGPFNQTNEILYENVAQVIGAPDSDFGIYRVSQRLNEDGTYSGSLTYSTSDNNAYAKFQSEYATLRSENTILYRDRRDIVVAGTTGQAGVYAASNSLNERGLYDGRLVYQTSNVKGVYFVASQTPFAKTSEILYENNLSQLGAPPTTVGIYRVAQRLNLDGTYSGSLTYNETVAGGEARVVSRNSTLRNDIDVIYKSKAAPVPATASAQGYIYDVSNDLREDGLYDARLVYQANQPFSIGFSNVKGPIDVSQSILYENNALKIDPPAGVDGLYTANQRVNDDGTYSGTLVYSKGIPVEMYKTWKSDNRTVGQWIYLNQETVTIPTVSVYNANSLTGLQYKNDGTYDFAFTSENNDTIGTTPIAEGYMNQIYMYSRNHRVWMYWNQSWSHSRVFAHQFAEGTAGASFGTKTVGTTIVDQINDKKTTWDRSGKIWWAGRVEVL